MKRMALIFFTLLLCCNAFCGTRRALVVFVGDYPTESGCYANNTIIKSE